MKYLNLIRIGVLKKGLKIIKLFHFYFYSLYLKWKIIIQPEFAVDCSSVDKPDAEGPSTVEMSLVFIVDIRIDVDWYVVSIDSNVDWSLEALDEGVDDGVDCTTANEFNNKLWGE